MLIWILRTIFVIVIAAVLFVSLSSDPISSGDDTGTGSATGLGRTSFWVVLWTGTGMAIFIFLLDVLTPKKKLSALAGVFFGLLVGMLISWAFAAVVDMLFETYPINIKAEAVTAIKSMLGICICYLVITVVIRTKDDVRFVVPYVEFAKQTKGARPMIMDTSAIIDGRIADLCQSRLFDAPLIVPRFVLNELQLIADSTDKLKRNRGRRGLDILNKMQTSSNIDVEIDDTMLPEVEEVKGVDQKLVLFTKHYNGRLATTDYNLTKVAQVREVDVVNINDLANCLKVVALPGETLEVKIIKPGEEAEQGIGYLADGTMIVVENARNKIGQELLISVTSSLQTSAGKMIFGKFEGYLRDNGPDSRRGHYTR
ncbi:MAG: TRAM domain-containing protein, partial [Planctomycetota bacterium]